MLTIHHLGVSQSDRVVWLVEELGLPYELKWYSRGADGLMPPEYVALHPASTAPVVDDDGKRMVESAAILETLCHRHASGRLTVAPSQPNYYDYVYWMHFNNNVQGLFFAKLALGAQAEGPNASGREDGYYKHLNDRLGQSPYRRAELTCADIMVASNLTELALRQPEDRRPARREGVRGAASPPRLQRR
jgi:glutathione S-transferase